MRRITQNELDKAIELHGKWLRGEDGGKRLDFSDCDLSGCHLDGANLYGASLDGANLDSVKHLHFQICPQEGAFDCYKSVRKDGEKVVIKLRIPPFAKRTSSIVGRKCRAEFAYVLEGSGTSGRGGEYIEGKTYYPDGYNDDPRVECTNGVYFFMTREEAEEW